MTKAYQPHLEKYGLTYPQYIVMLAIFEAEAIDFKELSKKVNLTTGTMTPIINRLEKLEYINKEPNPEDSRKVNIVLSQTGKELYKDIVDVPSGLSQRLQVSLEMYATLVEQLDELNDMLDEVVGVD
jgi:DNA-binding MarR family transcriptional regulator